MLRNICLTRLKPHTRGLCPLGSLWLNSHRQSRGIVVFPNRENTLKESSSGGIAAGLIDNIGSLEHTHVRVHDNGYVQLVDCCPRLTPAGIFPESAVARAARVSTHMGLRPLQEDRRLIARLAEDGHTSPFEALSFVYNIRTTIEVARQFLRHRMFRPNEYSQRYKEIKPGSPCPIVGSKAEFMRRTLTAEGIRRQGSATNKQASEHNNAFDQNYYQLWHQEASGLLAQAEALSQKQFDIYHQLCALGVAREVARSYLPLATYTEIQVSCDANNLLKFWLLRCDRRHAQAEIADVAEAMRWLVAPLMPTIMEHYEKICARRSCAPN